MIEELVSGTCDGCGKRSTKPRLRREADGDYCRKCIKELVIDSDPLSKGHNPDILERPKKKAAPIILQMAPREHIPATVKWTYDLPAPRYPHPHEQCEAEGCKCPRTKGARFCATHRKEYMRAVWAAPRRLIPATSETWWKSPTVRNICESDEWDKLLWIDATPDELEQVQKIFPGYTGHWQEISYRRQFSVGDAMLARRLTAANPFNPMCVPATSVLGTKPLSPIAVSGAAVKPLRFDDIWRGVWRGADGFPIVRKPIYVCRGHCDGKPCAKTYSLDQYASLPLVNGARRCLQPGCHDEQGVAARSGRVTHSCWDVEDNATQYEVPWDDEVSAMNDFARATRCNQFSWVTDAFVWVKEDGKLKSAQNLEASRQYPPPVNQGTRNPRPFLCKRCSRRAGHPILYPATYTSPRYPDLCFDCHTEIYHRSIERDEATRDFILDGATHLPASKPKHVGMDESESVLMAAAGHNPELQRARKSPKLVGTFCDAARNSAREAVYFVKRPASQIQQGMKTNGRIHPRFPKVSIPIVLPDDEDALLREIEQAQAAIGSNGEWKQAISNKEDRCTDFAPAINPRRRLKNHRPMIKGWPERPERRAINYRRLKTAIDELATRQTEKTAFGQQKPGSAVGSAT